MALMRFLVIGFVATLFAACGDDDSSDFATRPSGDSSSACEDCDDSSSSKAKSSSSKDVTSKSSDSETRESSSSKNGDAGTESGMTSSSAKSSSSEKQGDGGSSAAMTSSSAKSSSSSGVPEGYVDPSTVVTGTMTDERDGKTYKTVTIGTQTWMAENLNYDTDATNCYDGREYLCTIYGGLYKWGAAMVVCPSGWHLPDTTEWKMLITAVGGESTAGRMLKSTSGWDDYKGENVNGTDAYSFAVLPAGYYFGNVMDYRYEGSYTCFWSSTGNRNTGSAYYMRVFVRDDASLYYENNYKFSVRCVQDSE